ncbi:MAG: glycosyltransferase, partial [Acidisphaera sp.]|nr:glycosyltransferase [Acidisphaera sp.]
MPDEDARTALWRRVIQASGVARLRRGLRRLRGRWPRRRPPLGATKQEFRGRAEAALQAFLLGSERLLLPQAAAPDVSVLLVLFNQAPLTLLCLRAIAATAPPAVEVIIVDNASTDRTGELLGRLDGARVIRNPQNRHFLHAVNQAAAAATGTALLLLNNDACLRPGALQAVWETLLSAADIGGVGGRLVLPDGRLQEAGSIVWSDGSCLGYGRGRDPEEPEFRFIREVDYCSGAFLLLRRDAFERLGGFDPAYAPAYYEETDLCMRLRQAGLRVLYEPRAVIDHFEFASAASSDAALALQRRNQAIFVAHHRAALTAEHLPPGTAPLFARMRGAHRGRVLVIDDRVPFPSLGVGYPRASALLHALAEAGWFITFYPLLFAEDEWEAVYAAFPRAMEVMLGEGEAGLPGFVAERKDYFDAVLVSRPHNMRRFLAAGGQAMRARLIYDAEAVFATREIQLLALAGRPVPPDRQAAMVAAEMQLARAADAVLTVSAREAGLFREAGIAEVHVLGHALAPQPTATPFDERAGLLFVGALHDDPSPNTDSLLWFVREVMPLLDGRIGTDWTLIVAGRATAARVRALAGPRVRLLGRVADLAPFYGRARGFVAPTRYAGGIPHKVHEAAAYGLPAVATGLLAGQLGWSEAELLIADTPEAFAEACARLLRDPALWQRLREAALDRLVAECDPGAFRGAVAGIMAATGRSRQTEARPRAALAMPTFRAIGRLGRAARRALLRAPAAVAFLRVNGPRAAASRAATELRLRFGRRDYATWIALYDSWRPGDLAAVTAALARLSAPPRFSIFLEVDPATPPDALRATIHSVRQQIHGDWELLIAGDAADPALAAAAAGDPRIRLCRADPAEACGDFLASLTPGDTLRPHTLAGFALAREEHPDA